MVIALLGALPSGARAQDPITLIIQQGITRVIQAVDLKIQRLQNKTIWLQNAQKVVENAMTGLKLDEITGWVEKQRLLYQDYFDELQKVKLVISYYHEVKEVTQLQLALVALYHRSFDAIKSDGHFTSGEIAYMGQVYSGIIEESLRNLEGLDLVINSFTTQMTDAKRLEIIGGVRKAIQENYDDLKSFSTQNVQLSLARAKDQNDLQEIKNLYGLQ